MAGKPKMTIWITKYALSKRGIVVAEAEVINGKMAVVRGMPSQRNLMPSYFHGNDWHCNEVAARTQARLMVAKKIASLNKQLAKLKKLSF